MRMWMICPFMMCRQHHLGEHAEIHKHRHNLEKRHKMGGRLKPGNVQIEPGAMQQRHGTLAYTLELRGWSHSSPYITPDIGYLGDTPKVDPILSMLELSRRCCQCRHFILRGSRRIIRTLNYCTT